MVMDLLVLMGVVAFATGSLGELFFGRRIERLSIHSLGLTIILLLLVTISLSISVLAADAVFSDGDCLVVACFYGSRCFGIAVFKDVA